MASAERVFDVCEKKPEIIDGSTSLIKAKGKISFEGVSFKYGNGPKVLQDLNFQIEPGMRVGIVGATGSGKTTLVGLLMRFFDPAEGKIYLDGRDLKDYGLKDLRRQFAYVQQEPILLMGSIAENIRYGYPQASMAQVKKAAEAAEAHEFITHLPEGYDTQVGDRGMSLSGGERQRIALARAFLLDAPILLLDEPTSSLDEEREQALANAMQRLQQGKTILTISHRRELLKNYDLILPISNGKIIYHQTLQTAAL